jgi:hypothetical protein
MTNEAQTPTQLASQFQECVAQVIPKSQKPTVYLADCEDHFLLSSYPGGHPEAEKYEIDLVELSGTGTRVSPNFSIGVLRNILERAGVHVVIE